MMDSFWLGLLIGQVTMGAFAIWWHFVLWKPKAEGFVPNKTTSNPDKE